MRKLLLLLLLFPILASAQTYHPLVKENAVWRDYYEDINLVTELNQYVIQGDTIIDSTNYKKLYNCDYSPSLISNKILVGGIREDSTKKVYVILRCSALIQGLWLPNGDEHLIYDFSLNVGDSIKKPIWINNSDSIMTVTSIDSVLIGNSYRKRWTLDEFIEPYKCIEGIGLA